MVLPLAFPPLILPKESNYGNVVSSCELHVFNLQMTNSICCNEIAFCFMYIDYIIVDSLGTVAQGDDYASTQAKVTLSLHVCIK